MRDDNVLNMRIAIDARMMGAETTRGIGRYIEELVRAELCVAPDHRYVLITRTASHPFAGHASVETVVADIPWYGVTEQLRMPRVFKNANADMVHVPHWNAPVAWRGPLVVTIHDLLLRHEPASAKASTRGPLVLLVKRLGYRFVLSRAILHARKILVPTQFVARDVASFYPHARGKIVVTGEGMPRVVSRDPLSVNGTDGSPITVHGSPYLLYVGSAYPHKGLQDLLAAWPAISAAFPHLRLVVAGEKDVFMKRLESKVESRKSGVGGRESDVVFRGKVGDDELQDLYRNAAAFVYPSHFEGFGLPPLEAIAAGCPVLSSDAGPLPDVLGNEGVIFFRAGDPNAILAAVQRLFADPDSIRAATARIAPVLAARHDWMAAAKRTLGACGDPRFSSPP